MGIYTSLQRLHSAVSKMLRYCLVTLVMLAAMPGVTWTQDTTENPEGTQDGPCPNIGINKKPLNWKKLTGKWHEQMRFNSILQPHQCPTSNTYGALPPNVTVLIEFTAPDGSMGSRPREGVILSDPNRRIFSNSHPSPGFPDPDGIIFETIYINYRNIHVFWTCSELEGDKHIYYVWVESRSENPPKKYMRRAMKNLALMGIDMSRFWDVGLEFCTEE